jgi:hypothetical protein
MWQYWSPATIDQSDDDSAEQTTSFPHLEITIICPTTRQPNENKSRRPPFTFLASRKAATLSTKNYGLGATMLEKNG